VGEAQATGGAPLLGRLDLLGEQSLEHLGHRGFGTVEVLDEALRRGGEAEVVEVVAQALVGGRVHRSTAS